MNPTEPADTSPTSASATRGATRRLALGAALVVLALGSAWALRALSRTEIDWNRARHVEPIEFPSFALLDSDSKPVTNDALRGHVTVLDVASMQCAACRWTRGGLPELQAQLPAPQFEFYTLFAMADDEPGALKSYQRSYRRVDPTRWRLLAFENDVTPRVLVELGLARSVASARSGLIDLEPRFFLIDAQARVRGAYSAVRTEELDWLVADARALAGLASTEAALGLAK
ncbi:MAG: hypothetical protein IT454_09075 [Planctomycetes bacterium]|nr:hypothetical protein [Planctomycetota bacterium]